MFSLLTIPLNFVRVPSTDSISLKLAPSFPTALPALTCHNLLEAANLVKTVHHLRLSEVDKSTLSFLALREDLRPFHGVNAGLIRGLQGI